MEYIQGQTLESYIRENGILPLRLAGRLMLDVCRAMTTAHRLNIIHRDLKPGNIMVRSRNRISILDFGFAREVDSETITGAGFAVGTVQYMSPEVLAGKPATQLSDIYSVGVVLYHCVTGRLPFDKSNLLDMMEAIETGQSVHPCEFNSRIPHALEEIILKAMSVRPENRHKSFVEFARNIKGILNDLPEERQKQASAPWHGDIEKSVHELLRDSSASASLRIGVREATILFSDIVGITPYFDKHGDTAGHQKIQTHNKILFPLIRKHRGKVIKTIGDAIMACFDQADDGVEAAIEMQRQIESYNARIGEDDDDERIYIRIGLHSGRSVFENRDVFGNTVNVAARIGSRASGGEILISSFTREMLDRNRKAAHFHGITTLKGKRDVYNLYSIGWIADPSTATTHNLPITAVRTLTKPLSDLGSETDADADTDTGEDTGPIPPVESMVDELVDLGSRNDKQVESDTAPAEGKPPTGAAVPVPGADPIEEEPTVQTELDQPVYRDPSWNLVPIETGEESTTSPPESGEKTVMANSAPFARLSEGGSQRLNRMLAGVAMLAAFGLGVGITWIFGLPPKDSDTGSVAAVPLSPTRKMTHQFSSSIATARAAGIAAARKKREAEQRRISEEEIDELRKKVISAVRKKGIMLSDNPQLLAEYRGIRKMSEQTSYDEALATGERTLAIIKGIRINKAFVTEKLNRFNTRSGQAHDEADARQSEDITREIYAAIEAGNYLQANRLLNRAFYQLESTKK
jgi:class 3 adenylate cyclase